MTKISLTRKLLPLPTRYTGQSQPIPANLIKIKTLTHLPLYDPQEELKRSGLPTLPGRPRGSLH